MKLFFDEETAVKEVPTLQMMTKKQADIGKQAKRIVSELKKVNMKADIETIEGFSQAGSGSMPEQDLPTTLVAIKPKSMNIETFAH